MNVIVELIHPDAKIPEFKSEFAAGADLYAIKDSTIVPNGRKLIPLGFKIEIPEGFEGQVRPRSGLALKRGITLINAPGTIDSDYRGEMMAALVNHNNHPVWIEKGERIAQLVIKKVESIKFVEGKVDETKRGEGGFGSTGL